MIKSKKFRPKIKVHRVTAEGEPYIQMMTPAHPVEYCTCEDCSRIRTKVRDLAFKDASKVTWKPASFKNLKVLSVSSSPESIFTTGEGDLITITMNAEVLNDKLPIDGEDYGEQPSFKSEPMSLGDRIVDFIIPDWLAKWYEAIK